VSKDQRKDYQGISEKLLKNLRILIGDSIEDII